MSGWETKTTETDICRSFSSYTRCYGRHNRPVVFHLKIIRGAVFFPSAFLKLSIDKFFFIAPPQLRDIYSFNL